MLNKISVERSIVVIKSFDGKMPRIAESACVSEWAYIAGDVEIGENSSVWPGAVIRADFGPVRIGRNTHIEDNCVLHGGPMDIGDNVIVGHCASVHARRIGNNTVIGMNATVLHKSEIGAYCVIGAQSLVNAEVKIPDGSLAVGVPVEMKQKLSERSSRWVNRTEENGVYAKLARKYKEQGF